MRIGIVMGTRPEVMKNYAIVKALRAEGMDFFVLHTGQHRDWAMNGRFFHEFNYKADFMYDGDYSFGSAVAWVQEIIKKQNLNLILVNGDTAAALAGALAGLYSDISIAHVEAGLRSYDPLMYEERNRIMIDTIAHYLFTYTRERADYLERRREIRGAVTVCGNTTMDVIHDFKEQVSASSSHNHAYVTLHRKEFTDQRDVMAMVFRALSSLSSIFEHIYFPVHPRTLDVMKTYGFSTADLPGVTLMNPVSALESLSYINSARLVLTDSGCIQEEAYILKTPCLTIRENTERQETLEDKANIVTGFHESDILAAANYQITRQPIRFNEPYGPHGAGRRIVEYIRAMPSRIGH